MYNGKFISCIALTLFVAFTSGCARRSALEPPGKADVRLISKPAMYSSTEGLVWLGKVRNYGYRTANQVVVRITFQGGVEGFSLLDTYDNNLRPQEEGEFEVYQNERRIDFIKVVWQEAGCHAYLYEYMGDLLRQEFPAPCD
jgi:hypothetical protein